MPCDTRKRTSVEEKEYKLALKELEVGLATGKYLVVRNLRGEVSVTGWKGSAMEKSGWCEGCALREISNSGNWLVRQKLANYGVIPGKMFILAGHTGHKH